MLYTTGDVERCNWSHNFRRSRLRPTRQPCRQARRLARAAPCMVRSPRHLAGCLKGHGPRFCARNRYGKFQTTRNTVLQSGGVGNAEPRDHLLGGGCRNAKNKGICKRNIQECRILKLVSPTASVATLQHNAIFCHMPENTNPRHKNYGCTLCEKVPSLPQWSKTPFVWETASVEFAKRRSRSLQRLLNGSSK